jgi:hypothetical protein
VSDVFSASARPRFHPSRRQTPRRTNARRIHFTF